jgi:hypothetical protein
MSTAALIVAIVSIIISVASLSWQAASFSLSGPRVKVSLRHGAAGRGGIITGAPGKLDLGWAVSEGYTHELLAVEATNVGRMAVAVTKVSASFPSGFGVSETQNPFTPVLPHRLEAQTTQTYYISMEMVRRTAYVAFRATGENSQPVSMLVELGNGKTVKTPESLEISAT